MNPSELPVQRLLSEFPEPLLLIEPEGKLVFSNAAARSLLEVSAAEALQLNITQFLPERERNRLQPLAWLQRWADTPDAPEMDYVYLHCRTTTGRELPVRVRVGRVTELDDPLYLVMLQDISLEQSRQQQSRSAHRLAARVLAISADAIVTADAAADGTLRISYANPSAEQLFGYASGELQGRNLHDLLPVRFRGEHGAQISQFAAEAEPARLMGQRAEVLGLSRSGEEIPLEASITKVTLDDKVVFSAHLRDLRSRKQAEMELARSRASMQLVFEHALQAMALIGAQGDSAGVVLEMNAAARQLMPAEADPIGAEFATLPFWSDDPTSTRHMLQEALVQCMAGEPYRITTTISLPGGSPRPLDFSLTPLIEQGHTFAIIAEARELLAGEEPSAGREPSAGKEPPADNHSA